MLSDRFELVWELYNQKTRKWEVKYRYFSNLASANYSYQLKKVMPVCRNVSLYDRINNHYHL